MDLDPPSGATQSQPPQNPPAPAPAPVPPAHAASRGGLLTALVVVEGILLFFSTGALFLGADSGATGGYPPSANFRLAQALLALAAIVSFTLPLVIGMLARTWRAAVTLPMLAVWLGIALTFVAALLRSTGISGISLAGFSFAQGLAIGAYWLNLTFMLLALSAFALFGALGWIGWAAWGFPPDRD